MTYGCPLLCVVSLAFSTVVPHAKTWCRARCSPLSLHVLQQNRIRGHRGRGSRTRVCPSVWKFSKKDVIQAPLIYKVFLMMQLAISTPTTIGLYCTGSIALKSLIVKVIGGMLGTWCQEIMLTNWNCWRCLFCVEEVAPPPVKPPTMLFMTRLDWSKGLSSFSLERLQFLCMFDHLACSQSLPCLDSGHFLPSGLYDYCLWTNFFRWPSWMNSCILSFRALHFSVECPQLQWYQ